MDPASSIYEAALLEQPSSGPRRRKTNPPPLDAQLEPGHPGRVDLVVRRKEDGEVIVRTPADIGSPDAMLSAVRNDLETMSAEEFFQEWKMPVIH